MNTLNLLGILILIFGMIRESVSVCTCSGGTCNSCVANMNGKPCPNHDFCINNCTLVSLGVVVTVPSYLVRCDAVTVNKNKTRDEEYCTIFGLLLVEIYDVDYYIPVGQQIINRYPSS
jgi:hypothetical protein